MKPLLSVLDYTWDDGQIWANVLVRVSKRWAGRKWDRYSYICQQSDRRDAALMLNRVNFQQRCADLRAPQMGPSLYWGVLVARCPVEAGNLT